MRAVTSASFAGAAAFCCPPNPSTMSAADYGPKRMLSKELGGCAHLETPAKDPFEAPRHLARAPTLDAGHLHEAGLSRDRAAYDDGPAGRASLFDVVGEGEDRAGHGDRGAIVLAHEGGEGLSLFVLVPRGGDHRGGERNLAMGEAEQLRGEQRARGVLVPVEEVDGASDVQDVRRARQGTAHLPGGRGLEGGDEDF